MSEVSISVQGDNLSLELPKGDRELSNLEAFVCACFSLWVAADKGDKRAEAKMQELVDLVELMIAEKEAKPAIILPS